jgi:hypothetical protein
MLYSHVSQTHFEPARAEVEEETPSTEQSSSPVSASTRICDLLGLAGGEATAEELAARSEAKEGWETGRGEEMAQYERQILIWSVLSI